LLGNSRYLDAAETTLKAGAQLMQQAPGGHACLANALEEHLYPPTLLILRGKAIELAEQKGLVNSRYAPRLLCFAIPDDETELPDELAAKAPQAKLVGYICEGMSCQPPVQDIEEIRSYINRNSIASG
jgi:uncharacterized protein YyaL (SSP411 family)